MIPPLIISSQNTGEEANYEKEGNSSGDDEYGKYIYIINDTTPDLTMQFALKHDAYEDSANPWFIAYDDDEGWQHISKEDYTMRDYNPDQYEKLDFKPLSKIK